jgi:hypothetical protein
LPSTFSFRVIRFALARIGQHRVKVFGRQSYSVDVELGV